MTMVCGDPAGFAVDWDWQCGLTVWVLAGRRSEPRFDRKVLEHELSARPASERQARAAARRWWRTEGRAGALSAARASAGPLERLPPDPAGPVAVVRKLSASGSSQARLPRCRPADLRQRDGVS